MLCKKLYTLGHICLNAAALLSLSAAVDLTLVKKIGGNSRRIGDVSLHDVHLCHSSHFPI